MAKFRQPPYSVAEANIISKSITANGTYNASSDSADGYNPVTVNVPESVIISKSITANGTYNASSDNANGYNPVTVNVPGPVLGTKNISANGTYTASADGYDGYSSVTVAVSGGGQATITVSYGSSFYNKTMTCSDGITTYTETTTNAGSTVFSVNASGTWTISCDGVSRTVDVVLDYTTQMAITKTITVYGAASDTISFTDMTGAKTVTTDTSGQGSVSITFIPPSTSITFTSSVSKNPSNLSQVYSKTITIDNNTTSIYVMPDNALYWYGNECSWITNGWNGTGYSINGYTNPNTIAKSTNYFTLDIKGNSTIDAIGIQAAVDITSVDYVKCIGYKGSSLVSNMQASISALSGDKYIALGAENYGNSYWENIITVSSNKTPQGSEQLWSDHSSSPQAIKIYAIFLES